MECRLCQNPKILEVLSLIQLFINNSICFINNHGFLQITLVFYK